MLGVHAFVIFAWKAQDLAVCAHPSPSVLNLLDEERQLGRREDQMMESAGQLAEIGQGPIRVVVLHRFGKLFEFGDCRIIHVVDDAMRNGRLQNLPVEHQFFECIW